jgi:uncharacterized protein (TIGR02996 family)
METYEDACAFLRKYLTRPTDAAARLVFADWLEDTGQPQNVAWAYYIRLKHEAEQYPLGSSAREDKEWEIAQRADAIRTRLTIPAHFFIGYPKSLLQLLPPAQITVRLTHFTAADHVRACIPGHHAHNFLILPLDCQEAALLVASANPRSTRRAQHLERVTGRNIVMVAAEPEDLHEAIERHYPVGDPEEWDDSDDAIEFDLIVDAAEPPPPPLRFFPEHRPYPRSPAELLQQLLQEAVHAEADRLLFFPDSHRVIVRYRWENQWFHADPLEPRWLIPLARELAQRADIPLRAVNSRTLTMEPFTGQFSVVIAGLRRRIRVTIQPSPDGPTMQVDLNQG